MLDIQELRRKLLFESGGVRLPDFSVLPRDSSAGRLEGIFGGGVVATDGGAC